MNESFEAPDPAVNEGGVIEQPAGEHAEGPAAGEQLLAIPGVEGVGATKTRDGDDAILVFVRDAAVTSRIPSVVGGLPTIIEVTGQIDALRLP